MAAALGGGRPGLILGIAYYWRQAGGRRSWAVIAGVIFEA
jgi:hypothetical protein